MPIVKVHSTGQVVTNCYSNSTNVFDNGNSEASVAGYLVPHEASLICSSESNAFSYAVETMPNNEEKQEVHDGTDLVMHCYIDQKPNVDDDDDDEGGVVDEAADENGEHTAVLTSEYLGGKELHIETTVGGGRNDGQHGIELDKSFNFIQLIQDGTRVIGRMISDEHDMSIHEVEVVECAANEVEVSSVEGGNGLTTATASVTPSQSNLWSTVASKSTVSPSEGATLLVAIPSTSSVSNSYIVLPSGIVGSQQIVIPASHAQRTPSTRQNVVYQPVEGPMKILPGNSQFKNIEPSIGRNQTEFNMWLKTKHTSVKHAQ